MIYSNKLKYHRDVCIIASLNREISISEEIVTLFRNLEMNLPRTFIILAAFRHSLEHIGEYNDASFDLTPDKAKDHSYNKALECLRKHLHVIECVLIA